MANWVSELKKVVERSASNNKNVAEGMRRYANVVAAAQSFISVHSKFAPKITAALAEMMMHERDCSQAAAELIVCEKDLAQAKKDKDKAKTKEIEAKMKPLVKTFETARKNHLRAAEEDIGKAAGEMVKAGSALNATLV